MNTKKYFERLILFLLVAVGMLAMVQSCSAQPGQRIMLPQLEQSKNVEGTKAGQIGLTNAAGDQRYGQYVEIATTPITYVPTPTGNTSNISEFVEDSLSRIWYIDWDGDAVLLKPEESCDQDWLRISDNGCPEALTDSIYKYKYASIGARMVWPRAELLVSDSVSTAVQVLNGNRNAIQGFHDNVNGTDASIDFGGAQITHYIESTAEGGVWQVATSTGTAEAPFLQTRHIAVNANDSSFQLFQYPNTRNDSGNPVNVLTTATNGKVQSHPVSEVVVAGGGVTGTIAATQVAFGSAANVITGSNTLTYASNIFKVGTTGTANTIDFGDSSSTTTPLLSLRGLRLLNFFDNAASTLNSASMYFGLGAGRIGFGGVQNTGFGTGVFDAITTAQRNAAFAWNAGGALTTGSNNTLFGEGSGSTLTTGNSNLLGGLEAGNGITTGSANVHLTGEAFGHYTSLPNLSNTICIGAAARARASERFVIAAAAGHRTWFGDENGYIQSGYGNSQDIEIRVAGIAAGNSDTPADGTGVGGRLGKISLYGPNGTGTGYGGDVILGTCLPGASGSAQNTPTDIVTVKGTTGGFVGFRESTPTSSIHINGANGYTQLRLNDSYTPSSSADANGAIGDVAWDDDYWYVKTNAGWKRAALSSF